MEDSIIKWIREAKRSRPAEGPFYKNLYVLVGPPAVGKTSWIETNIANQDTEFIVISRDQIIEDEIFPKYKLTNNELYAMNPPEDAEVGKIIPGMEKFGVVATRSSGRKVFSNVAAANAEVENLIKKEYDSAARIINQLPEEQGYNVVIDAINATPVERQKVISKFQSVKGIKKIAVYFNFKDYKDKISSRAEKRAEQMKKQFGYQFDRAVPSKAYEAIFKRIEKPTEAEGFDDVVMYDSFKGVNLEPSQELTAESATLNFRNFLNSKLTEEEVVLNEAKLSRIWRRRAKARAKRHEREYPNKIDRSWALKQQEKWNKQHPELEEEYLKEIEHASGLAKTTNEYLNKLKEIRKSKMKIKKFGPNTPKKSNKSISVPMKPEHGGFRKGLEKNIKKLKKSAKGSVGIPMGASFAGLEEQEVAPAVTAAANTQPAANQVQNVKIDFKTYGDVKKAFNALLLKKQGKQIAGTIGNLALDGILGAFPFAGTVKTVAQAAKEIVSANDTKKSNTWLDKLNVDDNFSKIVDDTVEQGFINYIIDDFLLKKPDNESLPADFNINKEFQDWLSKQYVGRTVKGGTVT